MASFEEAITLLFGIRAAAVAVLGDRVFDTQLPQVVRDETKYPATTWQVISRRPLTHSTGQERAARVAVQIDSFGRTPAQRRAAAGVVRDLMTTWRGPYAGIDIDATEKREDFDVRDTADDGSPFDVFRNVQRWDCAIREPSGVAL